jgi:hypothetical protein
MPAFRYSTGNVTNDKNAQAFSWETPIPVNRFWDSFIYCNAACVLINFSDEEYSRLPIDPESDASESEKCQILLDLLHKKIVEEEAKAVPNGFHATDYERWNNHWKGIFAMQQLLEDPEAERTIRMITEKRLDKNNLAVVHTLADYLVKVGKYAEAEELEGPVRDWMDGHQALGKGTPQAINARRIIAKAVWYQGRRREAEALITEIKEITENMNGKFFVYQDEERSINENMLAELLKAE